jgi:hypothetical protein
MVRGFKADRRDRDTRSPRAAVVASVLPFVDLRPARSVTRVEPRLEAEVSYAEIVEGRLRAPSWRGLL